VIFIEKGSRRKDETVHESWSKFLMGLGFESMESVTASDSGEPSRFQLYRAIKCAEDGLRPGITGRHPILYPDEELILVEQILDKGRAIEFPDMIDVASMVFFLSSLFTSIFGAGSSPPHQTAAPTNWTSY
jgi:hypothetical protein